MCEQGGNTFGHKFEKLVGHPNVNVCRLMAKWVDPKLTLLNEARTQVSCQSIVDSFHTF